jgi:hypothetical protein
MLEIINDDFKNCCCQPVKCDLPDTVSVEVSGFWSVWTHGHIGAFFPTSNCLNCEKYLAAATTMQNADEYILNDQDDGGCFDGATIGYYPRKADGSALCVQTPEWTQYFPWISGDPDNTFSHDDTDDCRAVFDNTGVYEKVVGWHYNVLLPYCEFTVGYSAAQAMSTRFVANADDLNHTFHLSRRVDFLPPVLKPNIQSTRSGDELIDAELLFDLYEQAPPSPNQIESGMEPWFNKRYSVDYRCNPRVFLESNNIYLYQCLAPGGIVPPKLREFRATGNSTAAIDFEVSPVPGTGYGVHDSLWVVSAVSVTNGGTDAAVGDIFVFDFYESPARGGEYRDSATPQQARVTEVDENGGVISLELVPQTFTDNLGRTSTKMVYYGRILCHPNGVAIPGTGYSEGDAITWVCDSQHPDTFGGQCITYQTATAYVTETNEAGGIVDWWMNDALHGYSGCSETHDGIGGSRGLYSDVVFVGRCVIDYAGYMPVRCSFNASGFENRMCFSPFYSSIPERCDVRFVPLTFTINSVPTKLNIDIAAPQHVGAKLNTQFISVAINKADGETSPEHVPPQPPARQGSFLTYSDGQEIDQEQAFLVPVSLAMQYVGSQWDAEVTLTASAGLFSLGNTNDYLPALTLRGTASQVNTLLSDVWYKPNAGVWGSDNIIVELSILPPNYDNPKTATAHAATLADNNSEAFLNYALYLLYDTQLPFVYPESRQPGAIDSVAVDDGGSCYAVFNEQSKRWVIDPDVAYALTSAWDDVRYDLLHDWLINAYAWLTLAVDVDVESSTFGQVVEVIVDDGGAWYVLHDYDQMWYATVAWDFRVGWEDLQEFGAILSVSQIEHRAGYIYGPSWRTGYCDDPYTVGDTYDNPLTVPGNMTLCESGDMQEQCKLEPNDNRWSFAYCPNDLLRDFIMVLDAGNIQYPNRPNYLEGCYESGPPDYPERWGPGYCIHNEPAKYGSEQCWKYIPYQDGSGYFWSLYLPFTTTIMETFGNGPIKFKVRNADPSGHHREQDVY